LGKKSEGKGSPISGSFHGEKKKKRLLREQGGKKKKTALPGKKKGGRATSLQFTLEKRKEGKGTYIKEINLPSPGEGGRKPLKKKKSSTTTSLKGGEIISIIPLSARKRGLTLKRRKKGGRRGSKKSISANGWEGERRRNLAKKRGGMIWVLDLDKKGGENPFLPEGEKIVKGGKPISPVWTPEKKGGGGEVVNFVSSPGGGGRAD